MNVETASKVLVVEEEPKEREGLADLIEAWGYRVETAEDGLDGMVKIIAWSPDVVVSAIGMPKMSGLELLERVRERNDRTKVVLATARMTPERVTAATRLGAYWIMEKPICPVQLRHLLGNAIKERGRENVGNCQSNDRTTPAQDVITFRVGHTTIAEAERKLILETFSFTGNKTHAAQLLGISLKTLRNKLNQYK